MFNKFISKSKAIFHRTLPTFKVNKEDEYFELLLEFLFDADYYLKQYPDVLESKIDPFEHYMNWGWKEGRNPSEAFSTNAYLSSNPDVEKEGVNPLLHFVKHGFFERRRNEVVSVQTIGSDKAYSEANKTYTGEKSTPDYAPRIESPVLKDECTPKTIAFYLPQFHPFKENDEWWGKGFTEWRNVAKAVPQFYEHYQPRLPSDLGYYDLRVKDVFKEQISMAKSYGVDGFCFHYYWFDGHRLMEKPLEAYLANYDLEHPFCLCWANENWSRRWDGSENDILIAQNHSEKDNEAVFYDLLRYFKDSRYITVEGKPLIVIYRPDIIPNVEKLSLQWRELAIKEGLPGLHIVATNSFGFDDHERIGFDAIVEFPPHNIVVEEINHKVELFNKNFSGKIFQYENVVDYSLQRLKDIAGTTKAANYYPTVMASWDNSARKPEKGHVFHNATPRLFHTWFNGCFKWSKLNHNPRAGFVFVNAWNEWAEGTYLEPDKKYGYAYLTAIKSSINDNAQYNNELVEFANGVTTVKKNENLIMVHVFYEDLVDEICSQILQVKGIVDVDIAITIPNSFSLEQAKKLNEKLTPVKMLIVENRGRDVWPFIQLMKEVEYLGYQNALKIHTKKSTHIDKGDEWRKSIFNGLLAQNSLDKIFTMLEEEDVGIVAPESSIFQLEEATLVDNVEHVERLKNIYNLTPDSISSFVGGTMFWFKFDALKRVIHPEINRDFFGPELGAIDGTPAHAFERFFVSLASSEGYTLKTYNTQENLVNPYN